MGPQRASHHWVTFVGGTPSKSGYVMFTDKKSGNWTKVEHHTDRPKAKSFFWGTFDATKVTFKSAPLGERWTAWMKLCVGCGPGGCMAMLVLLHGGGPSRRPV